MKVLVTGGRDYADVQTLERVLDEIDDKTRIDVVIHGDYRGADKMADKWAIERGIHVFRCPTLWHYYDEAAGPRRNAAMLLAVPDLVVAFPGGEGTARMVRLAKRAGVKVRIV